MNRPANRTIAYFAVSGACLVLHNGIMIAGDHARLPLGGSILASFVTVLAFGYVAHSLLTFREPLSAARFVRYGLAMAANLPTAAATIWLFNKPMGLPMIAAAPLSTVVTVGLNFVLAHWAIVNRQATGDRRP